MNAINLPLSPIPFELDPEDTLLGMPTAIHTGACWFHSNSTDLISPTVLQSIFLLLVCFRGERSPHHGGPELQERPQAAGTDEGL